LGAAPPLEIFDELKRGLECCELSAPSELP
jgi:hypothetical protein